MEWYHVYLFTRLDSIQSFCTCGAIMLGTILILECVFLLIIFDDLDEETRSQFKKGNKLAAIALAVTLLGFLLIPTQKEAAAIYLLPKLAHSDFTKEAQQLPTDAAKLVRLKLEQWIADMEPSAGKK